ncbi:dynein light chain type 1 domain-containing protein [Ditylenchus destructor]|nr:dynein light chain type 1 domain-containing protein [Ditylenchus destructor]
MLVILFVAILFVDAFPGIKLPKSEKVNIVSYDMTDETMIRDAVTMLEKALDNNVYGFSLLCNHLVDDLIELYHAANTGEWQCIAGENFGHFSLSEDRTL